MSGIILETSSPVGKQNSAVSNSVNGGMASSGENCPVKEVQLSAGNSTGDSATIPQQPSFAQASVQEKAKTNGGDNSSGTMTISTTTLTKNDSIAKAESTTSPTVTATQATVAPSAQVKISESQKVKMTDSNGSSEKETVKPETSAAAINTNTPNKTEADVSSQAARNVPTLQDKSISPTAPVKISDVPATVSSPVKSSDVSAPALKEDSKAASTLMVSDKCEIKKDESASQVASAPPTQSPASESSIVRHTSPSGDSHNQSNLNTSTAAASSNAKSSASDMMCEKKELSAIRNQESKVDEKQPTKTPTKQANEQVEAPEPEKTPIKSKDAKKDEKKIDDKPIEKSVQESEEAQDADKKDYEKMEVDDQKEARPLSSSEKTISTDTKPTTEEKSSSVEKSEKKLEETNVESSTGKSVEKSTEKNETKKPTRQKRLRELADLNATSTPETSGRPKRCRSQTQLFQSPAGESSMTRHSSSSGDSHNQSNLNTSTASTSSHATSSASDIMYEKNEFLAIRNQESGFYICRCLENVYKPRPFSIEWLDSKDEEVYDLTDSFQKIEPATVLMATKLKKVKNSSSRKAFHYILDEKDRDLIKETLRQSLNLK